jgi:hypothetical protein
MQAALTFAVMGKILPFGLPFVVVWSSGGMFVFAGTVKLCDVSHKNAAALEWQPGH